MKKKKGFVLANVVAIMLFVILLSNIIALTISFSIRLTINKRNAFDNKIIYSKIFNEFCLNNGEITSEYDFDILTIENEGNIKQKAVVVLNKNEQDKTKILFYAIYDFDNNLTLAKQSQNCSLSIKNIDGTNYYYLGNIIKYTEV